MLWSYELVCFENKNNNNFQVHKKKVSVSINSFVGLNRNFCSVCSTKKKKKIKLGILTRSIHWGM